MGTDAPARASFGALLRQYRLAAMLSQEALAERAGLSADAISLLERGKRETPRPETVALLAQALDLDAAARSVFIAAAHARQPPTTSEVGGGLQQRAEASPEPPHSSPATTVGLPVGNFLGALPPARIVAREAELGRLREAAGVVEQGQGRLVLLVGEPGIGKTRLAQELSVDLRDRGYLVAAGRSYESDQTVPYYPFLDALATIYRSIPPALREEASSRWPYLGAVLPDYLPLPAASGAQDEQVRVFRAVTGFLESVAERTPIALLLDDLHWADSASLKLLHALARDTGSHRILLVATYRDVEVGRQHPLEELLRELDREGLGERLPVRRLDREGTGVLVGAIVGVDTVSSELSVLVHERTEGNPFFVQQVVRVLVDRGDLFREDGRWSRRAIEEIEVPESIRSAVGHRLSTLAEDTQEVLHEASVLGLTFNFDDLLVLSGRDEPTIEAALMMGSRAGLLGTTRPDVYTFDHALTQQTLYNELPPRRRRRLHLSTGAAIEGLDERKREQRVTEPAWHFLQGDDPEKALVYALAAGDAASRVFAMGEAEAQYRTAAALAREL